MKRIKFLSIILAVTLVVGGCGAKQSKESAKDEGKSAINSKYINLTMVKPKTTNPINNKDKSVAYVMNLIYDGLFTMDENYNVVPQLVDSYSVSADGRSMNIKLKDAKWHDGSNVTSQDVRFTVDFIKKSPESPYNELIGNIASVNVNSSNELTIQFNNPYAFSVENLIFPIVSEDKLAGVSKKDIDNNDSNLIGNGPYKVSKFKEREGMTLVSNNEYYEELPGKMRDIKVDIVPDYQAQISMVMSLDSDIANTSLSDLSKFQEKEFNITNYEGREFEYVMLNYNNKFMNNLNFRKAIYHSINRKKIIEEGYMGDATLVNFPLNSKSKYYNTDIKGPDYDKEKAISYLDKVNLNDNIKQDTKQNSQDKENSLDKYLNEENKSDENNKNKKETKQDNKSKEEDKLKLEEKDKNKTKTKTEKVDPKEETKKEMKQLNLKIIVNKDNGERVKTASLISENLKAIGIKSTIEQLTPQEIDAAIKGNNYDLAILGWELSSIPDPTNIIKSSGYYDEKLNSYMTSLYASTTSTETESIYKSLQKYVLDNVAFISLGIRDEYIVKNRRIQGEINPNAYDVYEGISNLSIKDSKK